MDTDITKYLLYYLCMCMAISFFFPQAILGTTETSILGMYKVGINSTTNTPYIIGSGFSNNDLNLQTNSDPTQQGLFQRGVTLVTQYFQYFVDGLGNVLTIIGVLFKFIFCPFIFVLSPSLMGGAPFFVQMIFAIPLSFMAFMGIIKFIRGIY